MDFGRRRLEAHALVARAVAQVFWLQVVSLLVEIVGGFVTLPRLGVLPLFVNSLGLVGNGGQYGKHNQQRNRRGHQTSHFVGSSSMNLCREVFAGQAVIMLTPVNSGISTTRTATTLQRL